MVQNNITVTEGDDAGPPPNIQIPLNIRQIINEENNKYNMHTLARSPFYRRHDGKKTRRYPVPVRDRNKNELWIKVHSVVPLNIVIPFSDARVPFLVSYESYQPNEYTGFTLASLRIFLHSTFIAPSEDDLTLSREEMADFQNPVGRTGLRGRGVLHQWGENKQLVILIWRWLRDQNGENVTKGGQEMIQVLGIRKTKYLHWQLPKVFIDDEIDVDYQVGYELSK